MMTKDPNATLDYSCEWSQWLEAGEAIASSEWIIEGPDDILVSGTGSYDATIGATSTTIWLIGGTVGYKYAITNRITTTNVPPRIDDRTFEIKIKER